MAALSVSFASMAMFAGGCGSDACQTVADQLAQCGGGTTSTGGSSTSTSGSQTVCTDKEKRQAQCVLDAKVDLCKLQNKTATAADQMAYAACYANTN
jgi:hypothetical protein